MNTIVTSKQEILKQSRSILQTKGYRSISIRAIAQACHVSIGSIYNYFKSKTDLISETIESVWLEIFHPSNMESSPEDVDAWIEWVMQRLEESQTLYLDFFRLHAICFEKNEQKEGQKHMHKIWDHIEESLISVLMKDPKIRKDAFNASFTPKAFAHTLFSMLQSLALRGEYDPKIVLEIVHRVLYDSEMKRMKVQKTTLLLIASIVWIFAGFNILKIGLQEYPPYIHWYTIAISIVVFCVFQWFVFGKLVQKHTQRILDYIQEKQFVLKFFDAKSYIIMAVMMIGGIMIRTFHWLPSSFIAVFYTGLGASLFWAGLLFGCSYGKAIVQKKRKGDSK